VFGFPPPPTPPLLFLWPESGPLLELRSDLSCYSPDDFLFAGGRDSSLPVPSLSPALLTGRPPSLIHEKVLVGHTPFSKSDPAHPRALLLSGPWVGGVCALVEYFVLRRDTSKTIVADSGLLGER